jgi:hypothetical protein
VAGLTWRGKRDWEEAQAMGVISWTGWALLELTLLVATVALTVLTWWVLKWLWERHDDR